MGGTSRPFRHRRLSSLVPQRIVANGFRVEGNRFALPPIPCHCKYRRLVSFKQASRDWAAPKQIRWARAWMAVAGRAPDDVKGQ